MKFMRYPVHGTEPAGRFFGFPENTGTDTRYPAFSVVFIAGLAHPDQFVEIDEVAVVTG
jgi:enamine deaminase RidA (YjgF/YER057c/UK114 family)